jgi:hypothetical protein
MAFPRGSAFWRESSGVWPYSVTTRGTIGFGSLRSPASVSWNRHLRVVHGWRLASPGPETSGPLQHSVAQTVETGIVSTGSERAVRSASATKNQAANRTAISASRGKTRSRDAREGRHHRQDRARAQRGLTSIRRAIATAGLENGRIHTAPPGWTLGATFTLLF